MIVPRICHTAACIWCFVRCTVGELIDQYSATTKRNLRPLIMLYKKCNTKKWIRIKMFSSNSVAIVASRVPMPLNWPRSVLFGVMSFVLFICSIFMVCSGSACVSTEQTMAHSMAENSSRVSEIKNDKKKASDQQIRHRHGLINMA